jgi:hypothetical protein
MDNWEKVDEIKSLVRLYRSSFKCPNEGRRWFLQFSDASKNIFLRLMQNMIGMVIQNGMYSVRFSLLLIGLQGLRDFLGHWSLLLYLTWRFTNSLQTLEKLVQYKIYRESPYLWNVASTIVILPLGLITVTRTLHRHWCLNQEELCLQFTAMKIGGTSTSNTYLLSLNLPIRTCRKSYNHLVTPSLPL